MEYILMIEKRKTNRNNMIYEGRNFLRRNFHDTEGTKVEEFMAIRK